VYGAQVWRQIERLDGAIRKLSGKRPSEEQSERLEARREALEKELKHVRAARARARTSVCLRVCVRARARVCVCVCVCWCCVRATALPYYNSTALPWVTLGSADPVGCSALVGDRPGQSRPDHRALRSRIPGEGARCAGRRWVSMRACVCMCECVCVCARMRAVTGLRTSPSDGACAVAEGAGEAEEAGDGPIIAAEPLNVVSRGESD
jgi:hypothetical protein